MLFLLLIPIQTAVAVVVDTNFAAVDLVSIAKLVVVATVVVVVVVVVVVRYCIADGLVVKNYDHHSLPLSFYTIRGDPPQIDVYFYLEFILKKE